MGKNDQPDPIPTPAPKATEATEETAFDLMAESMKGRHGRKASFLTSKQRSKSNTNSLLGNNISKLGSN